MAEHSNTWICGGHSYSNHHTAIVENQSSVPTRTHVRQLTGACNSSSRGSEVLFWPPQAPLAHVLCLCGGVHTHTHTQYLNNYTFKIMPWFILLENTWTYFFVLSLEGKTLQKGKVSLPRVQALTVPKHRWEFWLPGNFQTPDGRQSNRTAPFWIKQTKQPTTLSHFILGRDFSLSVELQRERESSGGASKMERKIGTLHVCRR